MSTLTTADAFEQPVKKPWALPQGLEAVLENWQSDPKVWRQVACYEHFAPQSAQRASLPTELNEGLRRALALRGIETLYSHQAQAFEHAAAGRDVVIATPTASGKSLSYNLPILQRLATEASACALYVFPTKALARDQEESLRGLVGDAGLGHGCITYDGDTPGDARRAARQRSGLLLTNPDMLHSGILPHHAGWARLLSSLRYVVLDELHTYRGVFGSHLANVLRRLQRVARFHGANPTFLFTSATIGNPQEHASRLLGRPVELVAASGAPTGPRSFMLYNPPVINAELGIRASYIKSAVALSADLICAGVPTLVFGQSRNSVETMLKYLRDRLQRWQIDPATVVAYRGGYLPAERRRIEAGLRSGELRAVVATQALELGIDIGGLDAVVCAGYPGTVAGMWQRFGRAGRRNHRSLALLVTSSAPLDQYVAHDPRYLVGAPVEQARIDPQNIEILVQHLKCAAFELPFSVGGVPKDAAQGTNVENSNDESFGDLPPAALHEALDYLAKQRILHAVAEGSGRTIYHWISDAYPANQVGLRSPGWDNFVIVDLSVDRVIAEMDWRSVHTMLHEQAIYQHDAEQYQVERLDFEQHKAFVRKVKPDYYTDAMTYTKLAVLETEQSEILALSVSPMHTEKKPPLAHDEEALLCCGLGEVKVEATVVGYKKIRFHSHENVGYGEVHLPPMQMHTSAFWLTFAESLVVSQDYPRAVVVEALRGVGNAMHTAAVVGLMVDPHDLGRTLGDRADGQQPPGKGQQGTGPHFSPTLFLYDCIPGGIGLAPRLFEERAALLRRTRQLIEACSCARGCPACIGPQIGTDLNHEAIGVPTPPWKALALRLMTAVGVAPLH